MNVRSAHHWAGVVGAALLALSTQASAIRVDAVGLVSDDLTLHPAKLLDPGLKNAWGLSHSAASPFWISSTEVGTSPVYRVNPATQATTGPALGLNLRSMLGPNDWLVIALALTNGSNTTEQFHFYDEIDSNRGKTGSGRLAIRLPGSIEIGASGSAGPQDRSTDNAHWMWPVALATLPQAWRNRSARRDLLYLPTSMQKCWYAGGTDC